MIIEDAAYQGLLSKGKKSTSKIFYDINAIVKLVSVYNWFILMQVLLNEREASKVQDLAKIHAI